MESFLRRKFSGLPAHLAVPIQDRRERRCRYLSLASDAQPWFRGVRFSIPGLNSL